jgi:hypothetical protein
MKRELRALGTKVKHELRKAETTVTFHRMMAGGWLREAKRRATPAEFDRLCATS